MLTSSEELKLTVASLLLFGLVVIVWVMIGPSIGVDIDKLLIGSFGFLACRGFLGAVTK